MKKRELREEEGVEDRLRKYLSEIKKKKVAKQKPDIGFTVRQ